MLICCYCTECQAEHEVSDKLQGQQMKCQTCDKPFVVTSVEKKPEAATFGVQSVFGAPPGNEEMEDESAKGRMKPRLTKEGRHALVLPPPPPEKWSGGKSKMEEDEQQHFREFRHDSRALAEFLEREQGSDFTWLLIVGLLLTTLLVLCFLGWLAYLIISRLVAS